MPDIVPPQIVVLDDSSAPRAAHGYDSRTCARTRP